MPRLEAEGSLPKGHLALEVVNTDHDGAYAQHPAKVYRRILPRNAVGMRPSIRLAAKNPPGRPCFRGVRLPRADGAVGES